MSLFGSLLGGGDMEDDPFFGSHMRTMRQMNNMMNSLFADPFSAMGVLAGPQHHHHHQATHHHQAPHHAPALAHFPMGPLGGMSLMPFGAFPAAPQQNFNRLLSGSLDSLHGGMGGVGVGAPNGSFSSSSTVISMTNGPDGRPQVYKATSSTRVAPGGIKETQRTVQDSRTGTKTMAIGHHIGDRAHIVEREQNLHSGDREERQDFINLNEDEADDFNREWADRARPPAHANRLHGRAAAHRHSYAGAPLAIAAAPSHRRAPRDRLSHGGGLAAARRAIRASPLTVPPPAHASAANGVAPTPHTSCSSVAAAARGPYVHPSQQTARKQKNVKTVSGSPPPPHLHQLPAHPSDD